MKKKILPLLMAVMAVINLQAQTCKINATPAGKVIQFTVNLDSLKGQTLVTTVKGVGSNVDIKMAYEGTAESTSVDSVANIAPKANAGEASADVADVSTALVAAKAKPNPKPNPKAKGKGKKAKDDLTKSSESLMNMFGLNEVTSFIGAFAKTNGKSYEEYVREITEADTTKYQPTYNKRKWGWLKNYKSYSTLELSGIFGKDYGGDSVEGAEDVNDEDYGQDPDNGYNYGGSVKFSQKFVHGEYDENGDFIPNRLNFAWSVGGMFAMDYQRDYGWSYDILAKVGIQAGEGITLGVDALIGGGISPYAIYSTNYIDYRVINHNQWCFKYGLEAWASMNYGGNTYTTLFARIVRSVAPGSIYDHPTAKGWENAYIDFDHGSWQVGAAVGYKFGYKTDLTDKRLIASVSTGYNLSEKAAETVIELEKYNNVSPTLDFSYGLGYGISADNANSIVMQGGWYLKPNPLSKFAYIGKIYAGIGEYKISKHAFDDGRSFDLEGDVKDICFKAGLQLGAAYRWKSSSISATMRCGYHVGFDTDYKGFEKYEVSNLKGYEFVPTIGYSAVF